MFGRCHCSFQERRFATAALAKGLAKPLVGPGACAAQSFVCLLAALPAVAGLSPVHEGASAQLAAVSGHHLADAGSCAAGGAGQCGAEGGKAAVAADGEALRHGGSTEAANILDGCGLGWKCCRAKTIFKSKEYACVARRDIKDQKGDWRSHCRLFTKKSDGVPYQGGWEDLIVDWCSSGTHFYQKYAGEFRRADLAYVEEEKKVLQKKVKAIKVEKEDKEIADATLEQVVLRFEEAQSASEVLKDSKSEDEEKGDTIVLEQKGSLEVMHSLAQYIDDAKQESPADSSRSCWPKCIDDYAETLKFCHAFDKYKPFLETADQKKYVSPNVPPRTQLPREKVDQAHAKCKTAHCAKSCPTQDSAVTALGFHALQAFQGTDVKPELNCVDYNKCITNFEVLLYQCGTFGQFKKYLADPKQYDPNKRKFVPAAVAQKAKQMCHHEHCVKTHKASDMCFNVV